LRKKDEQLQQALSINETLQKSKSQEEIVYKNSISEVEKHIIVLKQEYFFSMALAIKLSFLSQELPFQSNKSIHNLWESIQENHIPFSDWKKVITRWFVTEL